MSSIKLWLVDRDVDNRSLWSRAFQAFGAMDWEIRAFGSLAQLRKELAQGDPPKVLFADLDTTSLSKSDVIEVAKSNGIPLVVAVSMLFTSEGADTIGGIRAVFFPKPVLSIKNLVTKAEGVWKSA